MKVFAYQKNEITAIALGFNRGHAVKILAKELEKRGLSLEKEDPVVEIDLEADKKGRVIFLSKGVKNDANNL